jgi:hypothetical protein
MNSLKSASIVLVKTCSQMSKPKSFRVKGKLKAVMIPKPPLAGLVDVG